MTAMNWTDWMFLLLGWFAIGVVVAVVMGRVIRRGSSDVGDGRVSPLIRFVARHFLKDKNVPGARPPEDTDKDAISLRHSGPRTITPH